MTDPGSPAGGRKDRYGGVARFFHWSIAGLIVLQYVLAEMGEHAEDAGERLRALALLANHKSVGMTVFVLAFARVAWRFLKTPPELPLAMPTWQRTASFVSHWSLYALIFALPVTGWLMSSAAAYSVSWFNLFTWPDLVAPSTSLRDAMKVVHELLGKLLFVVVILHIGAALKHHFLDRDDVLRRMSSVVSWVLFAAIFAGGAMALTRVGGGQAVEAPAAAEPVASAPAEAATEVAAEPAAEPTIDPPLEIEPADTEAPTRVDATEPAEVAEPVATADAPDESAPEPVAESVPATAPEPEPAPAPPPPPPPPVWQIDSAASFIEFTAEQAGAPFTGRWTDWSADMRFDAAALEASRFDVAIRVAGVNTNDSDRDATLQDAEFFHGSAHPVVRFLTGPIRADGDGFASESTLRIKGTDHPVTFRFAVEENGTARVLTGTARLDRLALGVGTGEWADTEWVGQYVDVNVRVEAVIASD